MDTIELKLSELFLFAAGVFLLISLPFLADRSFSLWALSKTLYGIGVALFLFDK